MGTTHKGHTSCIEVFLLEHLLHCELKCGQRTTKVWAEDDSTACSLPAEGRGSTLPV